MKELQIIFALIILGILIFLKGKSTNDSKLNTGCISFVSLTSTDSDGFAILTNTTIPSKTKIHFTDSEWNGNYFGIDENDIIWETGDDCIKPGTTISFNDLDTSPSVSHGAIIGSMKISKKSDAIFAYLGHIGMPSQFLAAVANNEAGYGTLLNTGLVKGKTAVTLLNHNLIASFDSVENRLLN